jgi:putative glutamine amidotransferase
MTESPLVLMTLRAVSARAERTDPSPFALEWQTNLFARSVANAGGLPVFVSNECPPEGLPRIIERCDGLFLTGGEDIAPEHFGATDTVGNLQLHPPRDRVELAAIAAADRLGVPILGVCRGIQILNVARGGTLYQDLPQEYPTKLRDHERGGTGFHVQSHAVAIEPDCRLHQILGTTKVDGATSHHQALRDIGRGLIVVGHSPEDGVIEAVEGEGERFVVAVQWHPEIHADADPTTRLFAAFIDACREYAQRRQAAIPG